MVREMTTEKTKFSGNILSTDASAIIYRIKVAYSFTTDKELGDHLGVKSQSITNARKKVPFDWVVRCYSETGTSFDTILTGEEKTGVVAEPCPGEISATIGPGNNETRAKLIEAGQRATARNVHLRQIVEWMDQVFGQNEEQALFFYEDIKERYSSFFDFMERKRPERKDDTEKKSLAS